jgi:hypothetical protein
MEREKNAVNCILYRPIDFGVILRLAKLICYLKIREREVRTRLPCRILRFSLDLAWGTWQHPTHI